MLERAVEQAAKDYETHVDRLQRYIRQPSVSAENRGHAEMAALIVEGDRRARRRWQGGSGRGFSDRIRPLRRRRAAHDGHALDVRHDARPTSPRGSCRRSKRGASVNYENLGECIVGRGAEDTKGPLATLVSAVQAYRAANVPLPCNVIMVVRSLRARQQEPPAFVESHADEFEAPTSVLAVVHPEVRRHAGGFPAREGPDDARSSVVRRRMGRAAERRDPRRALDLDRESRASSRGGARQHETETTTTSRSKASTTGATADPRKTSSSSRSSRSASMPNAR